ncbi:hypothetical protein NDU88_007028 [Pleurodeles waltl]|uniref:Reverse transcriptase domain-containing protein n=1 Tax=Pleurodeles waltl TaxID=8319 RepID=A0AAV7UPV9_PLEWA|nr:hypothetical protein NDU88_007028 [Pleurodeles waltl]
MVNRLKGAMEEILYPDQTCGVPGRWVADSLALIRDTIQYITDRNIRAALVCLDQEKNFDHVCHEFMQRGLQGFGLGERFYNYVKLKKNPNIGVIPTPGDAKVEVKCALYMDNVTLFCADGKSVQSLLEACKDFGKASGAKINVDKSQEKLFG